MLSQSVTSDMIYSAVTAYLVAAIAWACAYLWVELTFPGGFQGTLHPHRYFPTASPADLIYFFGGDHDHGWLVGLLSHQRVISV